MRTPTAKRSQSIGRLLARPVCARGARIAALWAVAVSGLVAAAEPGASEEPGDERLDAEVPPAGQGELDDSSGVQVARPSEAETSDGETGSTAASSAPVIQVAIDTLEFPPWPDMMLRMRQAEVGVQNPFDPPETWRKFAVRDGALVAHLETRTLQNATVQRVLVLDHNIELWLRRDVLQREERWMPAFGAPVRIANGDAYPAIARDETGAAWVWTDAGAWLATTSELVDIVEEERPRERLVVHPGDRVELDCPDAMLIDAATEAPLDVVAQGAATVLGGTGGWIDVTLDSGVSGRADARCGVTHDLIVSTVSPHAGVPQTGSPALVHFWASWCGPCVAELPEFLVFQQSVGVGRAVAVSEDFRIRAAEEFLFDRGIPMVSTFDHETQLMNALGGDQVLPYTALVDGRGRVVEAWEGKTDWSDPTLYQKLGLPAPPVEPSESLAPEVSESSEAAADPLGTEPPAPATEVTPGLNPPGAPADTADGP